MRAGRPSFEPTEGDRSQVRTLLAGDNDQETTARCLGISEKTLRKHFRPELDGFYGKMRGEMAGTVISAARAGNWKAAAYYLSCHGWVESERLTLVPGGAEVDPRTLNDAELELALARAKRHPAVQRAAKSRSA